MNKLILKANGIDVHYLRTGGDKPPVVLLHGLMASGACWTPLARALEKDYDVIMPDARGHGNSGAPDHGYLYDNLAADVMSFIDALGLASPVVLGHSMGGMTAAVVASLSPKRLRGLILADPTFLTPQRQREVYESDVADQHRRILSRPKEDLLTEMRGRRSRRSSEIIELLVEGRFQTSIHAFEVLTPPNPDYMQLIKTLDVPSLLVFGDIGSVVSPEMAAELAGLNRHLEVVQIKEAGHGIPYDQPEQFSAAIQAFLRDVKTYEKGRFFARP
jgi:pimeloyl-ACP methyl ester carboxylesterase